MYYRKLENKDEISKISLMSDNKINHIKNIFAKFVI